MIIQCPECQSRYVVRQDQIPAEGRTVRCAKCQHSWFQAPTHQELEEEQVVGASEEEATESVEAETTDEAPAAAEGEDMSGEVEAEPSEDADDAESAATEEDSDDDDEVDEAEEAKEAKEEPAPSATAHLADDPPPLGDAPMPKRNVPALPPFVKRPAPGWLGYAMCMLVLLGFGVFARADIVDMWEPAARFYSTIGMPVDVVGEGLEFQDLQAEIQFENNQPVLVVEGKIQNTSGRVKMLPPLQATVRSQTQQDLSSWSFAASSTRLLPDESTLFKTHLATPPQEAAALSITFVEETGKR